MGKSLYKIYRDRGDIMRISVNSNLRTIPTQYLINDVRLRGDETHQLEIPYSHIDIENNKQYQHWNGMHLAKSEKPIFWSNFHTEELIRCVMQRLSNEKLRTSLITQRTNILQAILRNQWTQSNDFFDFGSEKNTNDMRTTIMSIPGIIPTSGEKWQRKTEPLFAEIDRKSDWLVILDARTLQEIVDSGIPPKDIHVYSNGLRIVKRSVKTEEKMIHFQQYLTRDYEKFNPEDYILFWLNIAKPFDYDPNEPFLIYRPFIEIEGDFAFKHKLRGNYGAARPTKSDGTCIITGNSDQPLTIEYDGKEIQLALKFIDDIDGKERLSAVGFRVKHKDVVKYFSIHPDLINLNFTKEGVEVSNNLKNILTKELLYDTFRNLTKAFRICAKKQCNPTHEFIDLNNLGIPKNQFQWSIKTKHTPLEVSMNKLILTLNGWA